MFTPPIPLLADHELQVRLTASGTHSVDVRVLVSGRPNDPPEARLLRAALAHSAGDRTEETTELPIGGGYLWGFSLFSRGAVKRGQLYAEVYLSHHASGVRIGSGYIYDGHDLQDGEITESLTGRGALDWNQDGNDVAGSTDTTINLGASGARRVIRGFLVKYHADSTVATRTIIVRLRDVADTSGPTGFAIDEDVWESPTLTLTADEEGIMYVTSHGFVAINDEGTLSYADNTTAPNPFPLEVEGGETADLIIDISSGQAGDDYDVFTKIEEWLEV